LRDCARSAAIDLELIKASASFFEKKEAKKLLFPLGYRGSTSAAAQSESGRLALRPDDGAA